MRKIAKSALHMPGRHSAIAVQDPYETIYPYETIDPYETIRP